MDLNLSTTVLRVKRRATDETNNTLILPLPSKLLRLQENCEKRTISHKNIICPLDCSKFSSKIQEKIITTPENQTEKVFRLYKAGDLNISKKVETDLYGQLLSGSNYGNILKCSKKERSKRTISKLGHLLERQSISKTLPPDRSKFSKNIYKLLGVNASFLDSVRVFDVEFMKNTSCLSVNNILSGITCNGHLLESSVLEVDKEEVIYKKGDSDNSFVYDIYMIDPENCADDSAVRIETFEEDLSLENEYDQTSSEDEEDFDSKEIDYPSSSDHQYSGESEHDFEEYSEFQEYSSEFEISN